MIKLTALLGILFLTTNWSIGQYWQQKVAYTMDIDFDDTKHQFLGHQKLEYTNNSPDDLKQVFYHLYFNAFQPGSMMDVRSRNIKDPDRRVGDRISKLKDNEIGYQNVVSLTMNGENVKFKEVGTILEVDLPRSIKSGETVSFDMKFRAQVPVQIRRSGRHNSEGIDYSMTQWYPKMAEYDKEGWHANPYVGREFHGVWGDFDVTIHMNSRYTIGGTGTLQNPKEIGKGYANNTVVAPLEAGEKLHWHFVAKNVHDFAWAADPDYKHDIKELNNGTKIHFFYQTDSSRVVKNWEKVQDYTRRSFEFVNQNFGEYAYSDYSVIQGGDGGMEYPMATLILGNGKFEGLLGVIVHESIHSWYQGMLATNESKYPWMDEGFTTYAENMTMDHLFGSKMKNPNINSLMGYLYMVKNFEQEPLTTHADHYNLNKVYGISVYSKGAVFLDQLSYIVGKEVFMNGMLAYYNEWRFKHPTPDDFKRVMEKTSGIELDWYFEQFVGTTNTIDYGIVSLQKKDKNTSEIVLSRNGRMPMPLDVEVTLKDGTKKVYNVPLRVMRAEKAKSIYQNYEVVSDDWPWTNPQFTLCIDVPKKEIAKIEIDPSLRMADTDRTDNIFPKAK